MRPRYTVLHAAWRSIFVAVPCHSRSSRRWLAGFIRKAKGRLEDLVDFERVELERERRFDQRDQRRNAKSGAGEIRIEPAEGLDEPFFEPDFLFRLAQRRLARGLARVDLPAGKGDLTRVGAQVRASQGQENGQPAGPLHDRQKNAAGRARAIAAGSGGRHDRQKDGGGAQSRRRARSGCARRARRRSGSFGAACLEVRQAERGPELFLRQRPERARTRVGDKTGAQSPSISLAGRMGKKSPLERTPNQSVFAIRSVRPRATRS